MPTIDFSNFFTDVCHHSKKENSLFPSLEQAEMPPNMGPITIMLIDHKRKREIGKKMEDSAKGYVLSGNFIKLVSSMQKYVEHITSHLWKENNKLFIMAKARLQYVSKKVDQELNDTEESKLRECGKTREYYELLAETLTNDVSQQAN